MLGTSIDYPQIYLYSTFRRNLQIGSYKTMINSNGKSIVVVDDEWDIVNQIKRFLEAMDGLKVYAFTDPFAALDYFNSYCKDRHIVISGIRMPGMNGFEFVRKVREIIPTIKVLLMSAFEVNSTELSKDLRGNKIQAFIQKPIALDELGNIIQAQLKTK
jgi:DNA-binding NtrC family response regulator